MLRLLLAALVVLMLLQLTAQVPIRIIALLIVLMLFFPAIVLWLLLLSISANQAPLLVIAAFVMLHMEVPLRNLLRGQLNGLEALPCMYMLLQLEQPAVRQAPLNQVPILVKILFLITDILMGMELQLAALVGLHLRVALLRVDMGSFLALRLFSSAQSVPGLPRLRRGCAFFCMYMLFQTAVCFFGITFLPMGMGSLLLTAGQLLCIALRSMLMGALLLAAGQLLRIALRSVLMGVLFQFAGQVPFPVIAGIAMAVPCLRAGQAFCIAILPMDMTALLADKGLAIAVLIVGMALLFACEGLLIAGIHMPMLF